ncbi:MAG: aminotransferase class III-fold pyridoxal phosphate-dependent enzyme, partial [Pseudomonadota bacterium]
EEAAAGMAPGTHGSTYGGNPLGTACGNAVLDIVADEAFLEAVTQKALRFRQHLAELQDIFPDLIDGLRGKGLLTGIKLKVPNADVGRACFEQELLTVAAGDNVLRLIPPLTITDEEISDGVNRLRAALTEVRKAETSAA